MEAKLRLAVEADVGAVMAIERGSATAPHWPEAEYARMVRGEGPVRRVLLIAETTEVVGFAVGSVVAGVGELENVVVREDVRGRGFGKALCAAILAWCRSEGAKTVELEVRAGSAGARRLYQRLGFVQVGLRRGYYSGPEEDGVLFRIGLQDTP